MTVDEIYNSIVYRVYGDTPNIPASTQAFLRGTSGLIAKAHRLLQLDSDYWFMRATQRYDIPELESQTGTVVAGNSTISGIDTTGMSVGMSIVSDAFPDETYITALTPLTASNDATVTGNYTMEFYIKRVALPADFKREKNVISMYSLNKYKLKRIVADEMIGYQWDLKSCLPQYYAFYNGYMYFESNITSESTIILDYYKYIAYSDLGSYEDDVLIRGSDAIINYCCFSLASLLKDFEKARFFAQMYSDALGQLRRENLMRESAFEEYQVRLL